VPAAFVTDFEHAIQLFASHPAIGARARNFREGEVRRVHLARVHYHLYYRVTTEPAIQILALRHTSRN
jgi:plasmid stabilization system protein ParE